MRPLTELPRPARTTPRPRARSSSHPARRARRRRSDRRRHRGKAGRDVHAHALAAGERRPRPGNGDGDDYRRRCGAARRPLHRRRHPGTADRVRRGRRPEQRDEPDVHGPAHLSSRGHQRDHSGPPLVRPRPVVARSEQALGRHVHRQRQRLQRQRRDQRLLRRRGARQRHAQPRRGDAPRRRRLHLLEQEHDLEALGDSEGDRRAGEAIRPPPAAVQPGDVRIRATTCYVRKP